MSPLQLSKAQVSQISGRPDTSGRAMNARSFKRRPNDRVSSANRGIAIIGGYSVLLVIIEAKMIDQAVLFMLIIVASQTVVFARSNPRFLTFFGGRSSSISGAQPSSMAKLPTMRIADG